MKKSVTMESNESNLSMVRLSDDSEYGYLPKTNGRYVVKEVSVYGDHVLIVPIKMSQLSPGGIIVTGAQSDNIGAGIIIGVGDGLPYYFVGRAVVYSKKITADLTGLFSNYPGVNVYVVRHSNIFSAYEADAEVELHSLDEIDDEDNDYNEAANDELDTDNQEDDNANL